MRTLSEVGARRRLDEGRLHAYAIEGASRRALLALLGRAFVGSVEEAEAGNAWSGANFRIDASRDHLHAAVDGEAVLLPAPLELEVRPRALRVLVPRRPAE
jgi:diacylglycerol kinase family enzyme